MRDIVKKNSDRTHLSPYPNKEEEEEEDKDYDNKEMEAGEEIFLDLSKKFVWSTFLGIWWQNILDLSTKFLDLWTKFLDLFMICPQNSYGFVDVMF